MKINLIVAVDEKNGIGKNNQLPWHLPADLLHFKKLTTGFPIIMGRKTFDSIGRVLPNRRNIVISRQLNLEIPGAEVSESLQGALELCREENDIYIIGGAQIFEQVLQFADCIFLTVIEHNFDADKFFPPLDKETWEESSNIVHKPDEKNIYSYSFKKYIRI
ncbi:MAG: dihydrofolate reductase [Bacteroidetes bacterium]|nr:dihydrofolate reductase [Bacteroidota bacterium]